MPWIRSKSFADTLASRHPSEKETIQRLERLLQSASPDSIYSLDRISDLVHPTSREELALILAELVAKRVLRLIFRVEDPGTGAGIQDFDSLNDVPDRIHGWKNDLDLDVSTQNLRVLYELKK